MAQRLVAEEAARHVDVGIRKAEEAIAYYKKAKELHSSGSDLKDVVECARVAKATFEAAIEHMLAFLGDSEVTDMRYKALVQEHTMGLFERGEDARDLLRNAEQQLRGSPATGGAAAVGTATAAFNATVASKRAHTIAEMVDFERSYIDSLRLFIALFVTPLKTGDGPAIDSSTVTRAQIRVLFGNVEQLVPLHNMLLADLEKRVAKGGDPCVGDIYKRFAPFFNMYKPYCSNYEQANKLVDELQTGSKAFRQFTTTQTMSARAAGQAIQSFMIRPVQHIPRYGLLLEALLKRTPQDHADHEPLQEALTRVRSITKSINTTIDAYERRAKLYDIVYRFHPPLSSLPAPHRHFVKEGKLDRVTAKGKRQSFHFFLFNDVMAYGSTQTFSKGLKHQATLLIRGVQDEPDTAQLQHAFKIVAKRSEGVLLCAASSAADKASWIKALHKCTAELSRQRASISQALQRHLGGKPAISANSPLASIMSSGIGEAPSQDAEAPPAPAVGGGAGGGAGAGAGMGSGSDGKTGDAAESSATLAMIGEVGNLGLGEDEADEEPPPPLPGRDAVDSPPPLPSRDAVLSGATSEGDGKEGDGGSSSSSGKVDDGDVDSDGTPRRSCTVVEAFEADDDDQLTVAVGDQLTILDEEFGDWLLVQDALGMVGQVPSDCVVLVMPPRPSSGAVEAP